MLRLSSNGGETREENGFSVAVVYYIYISKTKR